MSLARVFRGSLGSLLSVLGHEVWCKISGVILYWSWSFGGLRCQGLLVCVCLALYHVSLGVGYLRSWSGVLLGSSGGKTILGNLRRDGGGMDGMGCGGTRRPGCCKQTFLLYAIVCTYHSLTCAHLGAWKCLICLVISFLVTNSDEFYVFDHRWLKRKVGSNCNGQILLRRDGINVSWAWGPWEDAVLGPAALAARWFGTICTDMTTNRPVVPQIVTCMAWLDVQMFPSIARTI